MNKEGKQWNIENNMKEQERRKYKETIENILNPTEKEGKWRMKKCIKYAAEQIAIKQKYPNGRIKIARKAK